MNKVNKPEDPRGKDPIVEIRHIISRMEQTKARKQAEKAFDEVRELIQRYSKDHEISEEGVLSLLEQLNRKK